MIEFAAVAASLSSDLQAWRSATAGPPLDKHASQIDGVVGQLSAALAIVDPADSDRAVQQVLDYHHIWEFFRTKLSLRYIPWYRSFLSAADDLAWAAWRPIRDAARTGGGIELREPPLVYFSRQAVPFAVPRGEDYQDLLPRGGIYTTEAEQVAAALVVPVISLPWHRSAWLPVCLSVAHEVGHVVVTDLDLGRWLIDRLAGADLPEARRPAWQAWREEVWADIFAAVVCGSTTSISLLDQLADDDVEPAAPPWGDYPPVSVRARLIEEVAGRRGGAPPGPATDGFEADAAAVVAALLGEDLPSVGKVESCFASVDNTAMRDDAYRLTRQRNPHASDIRVLLTAATLAFSTGSADERGAIQQATLDHADEIRDVARRGREGMAANAVERDRRAGLRLAGLLTR